MLAPQGIGVQVPSSAPIHRIRSTESQPLPAGFRFLIRQPYGKPTTASPPVIRGSAKAPEGERYRSCPCKISVAGSSENSLWPRAFSQPILRRWLSPNRLGEVKCEIKAWYAAYWQVRNRSLWGWQLPSPLSTTQKWRHYLPMQFNQRPVLTRPQLRWLGITTNFRFHLHWLDSLPRLIALPLQVVASNRALRGDPYGCCGLVSGISSDSIKLRSIQEFHSFALRSRSAFPITETELKLMAAAAIIGLNSSPKNG